MHRPTLDLLLTQVLAAVVAAFPLAAAISAEEPATSLNSEAARILGKQINNFTLRAASGQRHAMSDFADEKLLVVVFLGTECPLAKLYAPRLRELADRYGSKGVQFLGINSNAQDSLTDLSAYTRIHRLNFPVLKDPDNQIADRFGAIRTPEVFLLDERRQVRYWGGLDDQYAISVMRGKPNREHLQLAIEELLDGKQVRVPWTESAGCHIGRVSLVEPHGDVTYEGQIRKVLQRRCVSCHREGRIAPFPLTDFGEVVGWAAMIAEVVDEGRMPPWFADPKHGQFRNDARLTAEEKSLLKTWIRNGCPQGNKADSVNPVVMEKPRQWRIPQPHVVYRMSDQPFPVPAQGEVKYQYFVVDPGLTEDKFIQAVEVRPGNASVVHHALVSIMRPGEGIAAVGNCGVLINYAPGMQPTKLEEGMAIRVPAGSKFLFQLHYTPNGSLQQDLTTMGVVFVDQDKVKQLVEGGAIANPQIEIPPGKNDHSETAELSLNENVMLLSLSPHMHLRGKAFRYEAIYPNGEREILLNVPKSDFHWQLRYVLKTPKKLPQGTRIACLATYDNSNANLANPDSQATVRWGDQTEDEMLIGFYSVVVDAK